MITASGLPASSGDSLFSGPVPTHALRAFRRRTPKTHAAVSGRLKPCTRRTAIPRNATGSNSKVPGQF